ncbi:YrhB domain-containing protein [Amycolatopsis sp. PS_44_ISF1]|uniref:YrhB domain-containing protein n=1 Tax=Amycolatopsis sp. PS_44_ISF1 TaxID=2974917 RepID=UPI0028DFB9A1|nr:YrhB domain-containing protein [Amycolatopsis sp. PS_44_ISF1]MDT8912081.1 YrhB domain-containing protein [Amycolatopsis sp. PS_44_ISF1]
MIDEPGGPAARWLDRTYGGLVTVADQPFLEDERSWLVGCAYADAPGPLLAVSLVVPKDGGEPFPASNAAPVDETVNLAEGWQWRINARGCLVATGAAIANHPASALPWRPSDEAPGWWDRLLTTHFPGAEVAGCQSWDEVAEAMLAGGPDSRGAVWLRRKSGGAELTGHLLYAYCAEAEACFVDGQRGAPADLDDDEVGELVLARFHRSGADRAQAGMPTLAPAPDFAAAVEKAQRWLDLAYAGEVAMVDPDPADELDRGWLFACAAQRFLRTGDWRDQLLDAALVVPKTAGDEPFGLPNDDPWTWLRAWDAGEPGLPEPPEPATASWLEPATRELGALRGAGSYEDWGGALADLDGLSDGERALVWLRRRDRRGRETVGNLLMAVKEGEALRLIDSRAPEPVLDQNPLALHVLRFTGPTR